MAVKQSYGTPSSCRNRSCLGTGTEQGSVWAQTGFPRELGLLAAAGLMRSVLIRLWKPELMKQESSR